MKFINVSCLIFWLAILENYTENGQWPPVILALPVKVLGGCTFVLYLQYQKYSMMAKDRLGSFPDNTT